ncbi:MAG: hypothetical protein J7J70_07900 [Deltaproteobacteria bacterium]|nr:hypothetical protein [Candidatus Tharpellaceae bacterium]
MLVNDIRVKSARLDETNDNGKYQVIFAIDDEDKRQEFIDVIDAKWKEDGDKKKPDNISYFMSEATEEYPADEDTDTIIFIATKNGESKDGKELHVDVFNAAGVKYEREDIPSIGAGTIANLSVDLFCWTFKRKSGISTWLNKVQIVDLKEYAGADTFGNVSGEAFEDESGNDKKKKKKNKKNKNK